MIPGSAQTGQELLKKCPAATLSAITLSLAEEIIS
jgi:hypothetical protein